MLVLALLGAGCSGASGPATTDSDLPDVNDASADSTSDVQDDTTDSGAPDVAPDTADSGDTAMDTPEPDTAEPDTAEPDTAEPDTDSGVTDAGDAATDAVSEPDSSDAGEDVADDTTSDAIDETSTDVPPDGSCAYFEIDTRIASCGDEYVYIGLFRDIGETGGDCPDYWQARTDDGRHASPEDAAAAAGCDGACVWQAGMSVTWLRCGVRSGYIQFDSPTCDSIYEMPEGLFTSLEAHDQAHPCPSRPASQCVTSADCPGISICSSSAPGGICTGCGSFDDCPAEVDECSEFGACRRMCDVDDECPAGQSCGITGYCVIAQCVRGACPDPRFDCNAGNRCERRACSTPETECPTGTVCTSGYCVETR